MGKIKYDKILCLDLEATAWATKEEQGTKLPEIIQIGICSLVVQTGEVINKASYLIKPRYTEVSEYCSNLTGITPKMAKSGMPLDNALNSIAKNFGSKNRVWASFGVGDKVMLEDACKSYKAFIELPFSNQYFDISALFHIKYMMNDKRVSLIDALGWVGEAFIGQQHNAVDDALNATMLLKHILSDNSKD